MRFTLLLSLSVAAVVTAAKSRNILYYNQWHSADLPPQSLTRTVTHVMMSFASSSLFAAQPAGKYEPFQPLSQVRGFFDHEVKVCLSIGGWGDNSGFDEGVKTSSSREDFAKNIASTVDMLGFDCVDIEWKYPGGNGQDYKQVPNSKKTSQIEAFPKLLKEIKKLIGKKELSIAVPGLERDMIAYVTREIPQINECVDFVNVLSQSYYDILRICTILLTLEGYGGAASAIDKYISLGFPVSKLVVGVPFYAKWFITKKGYTCTQPIGCPVESLENPKNGNDTGKSGSVTFEAASFAGPPTKLMTSPDNTCGVGTIFECTESSCCGDSGWCGSTSAHCGNGCQFSYGKCDGVNISRSFHKALKDGYTDKKNGGQWYWDPETRVFWSWDTPELILKKISFLADTRGVTSVMAWALALDSNDWNRLDAMQRGFAAANA
ncbi:hypothetical protein FSARC_2952 [Fusarium sarcochroum]|uniref:chitinase n=1 Tax=Fusarium sarcochroum TaxID=1208366 RepID=A0A8H4U5F5_9HYPO|nr:hypothetical protein FSARC_2952 [Fusarium sarcochroum]